MEESVRLTVADSYPQDSEALLAGIDRETMERLGLNEWDLVKISGRNEIIVFCRSLLPEDEGRQIVRIGHKVREKILSPINDIVTVSHAKEEMPVRESAAYVPMPPARRRVKRGAKSMHHYSWDSRGQRFDWLNLGRHEKEPPRKSQKSRKSIGVIALAVSIVVIILVAFSLRNLPVSPAPSGINPTPSPSLNNFFSELAPGVGYQAYIAKVYGPLNGIVDTYLFYITIHNSLSTPYEFYPLSLALSTNAVDSGTVGPAYVRIVSNQSSATIDYLNNGITINSGQKANLLIRFELSSGQIPETMYYTSLSGSTTQLNFQVTSNLPLGSLIYTQTNVSTVGNCIQTCVSVLANIQDGFQEDPLGIYTYIQNMGVFHILLSLYGCPTQDLNISRIQIDTPGISLLTVNGTQVIPNTESPGLNFPCVNSTNVLLTASAHEPQSVTNITLNIVVAFSTPASFNITEVNLYVQGPYNNSIIASSPQPFNPLYGQIEIYISLYYNQNEFGNPPGPPSITITSIQVLTPGFTILTVSPALPYVMQNYQPYTLTVTLKGPSSGYNGSLQFGIYTST